MVTLPPAAIVAAGPAEECTVRETVLVGPIVDATAEGGGKRYFGSGRQPTAAGEMGEEVSGRDILRVSG